MGVKAEVVEGVEAVEVIEETARRRLDYLDTSTTSAPYGTSMRLSRRTDESRKPPNTSSDITIATVRLR